MLPSNKLMISVGLTLALSSAWPQPVQATELDPERLINEFYEVSGIAAQVKEIEQVVDTEIETQISTVGARYQKEFRGAVAAAYGESQLRQSALAVIRDTFPSIHMSRWLELMGSPLARKMTDLEMRVTVPGAYEQIKDYLGAVDRQTIAPQRLELLNELDQATDSTQLNIELQLAIFRGLASAINITLAREERLDQMQLEKMMVGMREQIGPAMKDIAYGTYLFTYRSASEEELQQYIELYQSQAGRWAISTTRSAILTAVDSAGISAYQSLQRAIADRQAL